MSEPDFVHIVITADEQTIVKACARDASTYAFCAGCIGPGILMQSNAAQWAGFLVFLITIIGRAMGKTKKLTIAQARQELDRIEQTEAAN